MSKEPIRFKQTEIGELPEEWEVKPLSDVLLDSQSGEWGKDVKEFNPDLHEPVRIIRSTEFTKDCRLLLGTAAERAIPKKKAAKILLQEGDILVERSGGGPTQPVGRVIFVEKLPEGNWGFGNFIQRLRVKPEYHPRYIWAVLFWHWLKGSVLAMQEQTTGIRNLRWSDYLNLPIPLPPLEEQKRIAGVLRLVDRVSEETRRIISIYERAKKFALKRLLTRGIGHTRFKQTEIGELPEEWEVVRLEDVARVFSGSSAPQGREYFENGIFPFVRVQDLARYGQTRCLTEVTDKVNERAVQEHHMVLARKGTILFPKSGAALEKNHRAILGVDAYIVSHLAAWLCHNPCFACDYAKNTVKNN